MIEDLGFPKGGNVSVIGAAMIAGFFASACSLPFDYVKTQIQKMKPDPVTGELPYKSPIDCALKTLRAGGPLKFYTGFPTYFVRIAPHGMYDVWAYSTCYYIVLLSHTTAVITLILVSALPKMQASVGL